MPNSAQRAAIAQVVLEGVALPASKRQLLRYARRNGAKEAGVLELLARIPNRQYGYLDQVGEAIFAVQPEFLGPPPENPRSESGEEPGGEAYTQAGATPGSIREAPSVLPYEVELVRGPGGERLEKGAPDKAPQA
jgi:hypothetical protein